MEKTNAFAERLKQIREEKKMTQKAFSEYLDIKQQTLSGYEIGKISPSLEVALTIAQKLEVSLDWLCGLSNERNNSAKRFGTYGEAFQQLVKIDKTIRINVNQTTLGGEYQPVITFNGDYIVRAFLKDWGKMLTLLHDKIIDESLYDLWVNQQVEFYNVDPGDEEETSIFYNCFILPNEISGE